MADALEARRSSIARRRRRRRQTVFWVAASLIALTATAARVASAEAMGHWPFDTMADTTDAAGGELLHDAVADNHFLRSTAAGERFHLSSVLPDVAPPGSLTLNAHYVPVLDTPATDRFSLGRTGELTVEFWYRLETFSETRAILSQPPGHNSWRLVQSGKSVRFSATDDAGVTRTVTAADVLADFGHKWTHLAVSVDRAGNARIFRDGQLKAAETGFTGFKVHRSTLRLGAVNAGNTDPHPGAFSIDDLRISDAALPPKTGTGNGSLAWKASLSTAPNPSPRPKDLGRRWVRSNPFTLNSYGIAESTDAAAYAAANLNAGLTISLYQKAAAAGYDSHWMGQQIRSYPELDDLGRTDMHIAAHAPRMTAWFVRDEPSRKRSSTGGMEEIVKPVADYIRSIDTRQRLIYLNAYPMHATAVQLWGDDTNPGYTYDQYLDDLMAIVRPDVLMYDHYPFHKGPTDLNPHFENLSVIRGKARRHGMPFFAFVQSFEGLNHHRLSSESELRFQLFSLLAGGAKGFSYFLYDPAVFAGTTGLRRREGEGAAAKESPSALYAPATAANVEVLNLGQALRFLESEDLRFLPGSTGGTPHPTPRGLTKWSAADDPDEHLQAVRIRGEGAARDGLLGFFKDDQGQRYFMLVNLNMGPALDAAAAAVTFDLTFDDSVKSVWRLNRLTGKPEKLDLKDHALSLTLPGGTGDLFMYPNGDFPGLKPLAGDKSARPAGTP